MSLLPPRHAVDDTACELETILYRLAPGYAMEVRAAIYSATQKHIVLYPPSFPVVVVLRCLLTRMGYKIVQSRQRLSVHW